MMRAFLLLPLITVLLIGCDDAVTDSISGNDSPVVHADDALNQSAFGKKNENGNGNDKGGGPGGGGGNDAFPTYSNILVENIGTTAVTDWYESQIMSVPSLVSSYVDGRSASEFFGCPDPNLPCYKITVTLDQADAGDAVAVRIYPFEEDVRCVSDRCPDDTSLGDDRRLLSLFDDYLGTPYVSVDAFDADGRYSFYWQGQYVRRYYDPATGSDAVGYYRYERDRDYGGGDLLRAQAAFYDASSSYTGYTSGTSLMEVDQCASANPVANTNEGCVFRHVGDPAAPKQIRSEIISVGEPTRSRGRNKTSSTSITVRNTLDGVSEMSTTDSGSDVWVVFLVDNIPFNGSRVRTVEATSNNSFTVSPLEGCLLIRPIQAELFANNPSEFDAVFSADSNGERVFEVDQNGALTDAGAGSTCPGKF